MATKRTSSKSSTSGKRTLKVRKDTLKDLTPNAGTPKGGAITPYAPGVVQPNTIQCGVNITPYKGNISY